MNQQDGGMKQLRLVVPYPSDVEGHPLVDLPGPNDEGDSYPPPIRDSPGCVSRPSIQGNPVLEKGGGGLRHIQNCS